MDFTTALASQDEPLGPKEDVPLTQTDGFVSQAPFLPPSNRTKRPLVDASSDFAEQSKRPKLESLTDLVREVDAELAKQRRTEQMLRILGRDEQQNLQAAHENADTRSNASAATERPLEQEDPERAEAARLGINLDFLDEQLAKIGDVSNVEQPPDEILFYAGVVAGRNITRQNMGSQSTMPPGRKREPSRENSDEDADGEVSGQEKSPRSTGELPTAGRIKSAASSLQRSERSSSRSPSQSSAPDDSSDVDIAAGSQEVTKTSTQSESSDESIPWSLSPARSVRFALERRRSEQLPPDSSALCSTERSVGLRQESSPKPAPLPPTGHLEDLTMSTPGPTDNEVCQSLDKEDDSGDTDSEFDQMEPHALGEELFVEGGQEFESSQGIADPDSATRETAPQVLETPYARRAIALSTGLDEAYSSTPKFSAAESQESPQTLIPSTIVNIAEDQTGESQSRGEVQENSTLSGVKNAIVISSGDHLSGASKSTVSSITDPGADRRTFEGQSKDSSDKDFSGSHPKSSKPAMQSPARKRSGVGESLNLSSQRLVMESPATAARRIRREFMARMSHGAEQSNKGSEPLQDSSPAASSRPAASSSPKTASQLPSHTILSAEASSQNEAMSPPVLMSPSQATAPVETFPSSKMSSVPDRRSPLKARSLAPVQSLASGPSPSTSISLPKELPSPGAITPSSAFTRTRTSPRATSPPSHTLALIGEQASTSMQHSQDDMSSSASMQSPKDRVKSTASNTAGRIFRNPIVLDDDSADDENVDETSEDECSNLSKSRELPGQQRRALHKTKAPWYAGDTPFKEFARNYRRLKILEGVVQDPEGPNATRPSFNVLDWEL